ncbi:tyrosine-type recombinase/integrase [Geodermatophilus marinus]|uniref:tyrosine-type recombinase/integrase n=1 Tax=Geodermatophilus sp. LHW52908 TaxID=2303986 RepID=UPI001313EB3B|nr:tyrosine-type recombinase/integrase [Geodermatophilus sp. LHW52908]
MAALDAAFTERLNSVGDVEMTATMPLVEAGRVWLAGIRRTDSGLAPRTVEDYGRTFVRYIDRPGATIHGLTLAEANNTQRLRAFLQAVADKHGTGAAKMTRSVLMGIFNLAVDNGTLNANALRNVRPIASQTTKSLREGREARDTTRALTRAERAALLAYADERAAEEPALPQTRRKWQAAADLAAFMMGTGVRVTEARSLRWEDVDLTSGAALIRGTKSRHSRRRVDFPDWLADRLRVRAERTGGTGYVFASPHFVGDGERMWDQSNAAKTLAELFKGAGLSWATPHTWRRTVATIAHQAGAPLVAIADQLGHADPSMTARIYLGRDSLGERRSVAQHL